MTQLTLINSQGQSFGYRLQCVDPIQAPSRPTFNRIAFSAAHVVADPRAAHNPWLDCAIDWDASLQYRHHLWSLGLGVAEAMDTAQRGMGLDWPTSLTLIQRCLAEAKTVPGALVACGCGTDHLLPNEARTLDDVVHAYETQMQAIEKLGGRLIIMASRALVQLARSPADYEHVYNRILGQAQHPVILHWLGDMFDPALHGYWGSTSIEMAMQTALGVIRANTGKVDGIKVSLLSKAHEIDLRRQLPDGVRMYTGDDFNYPDLIAGDGVGGQQSARSLMHLCELFMLADQAKLLRQPELAAERMRNFIKSWGVD